MSGPPADAGLPALAAGMIIACVVVMVTTNRRFGHQTFHNSKSVGGGDSTTAAGTDPGSSNISRSTSNESNTNSNSGRVFEGLPEVGVLEAIACFLSPADLVGIATVSTDFCRASASSFLWRCHCDRAFGASAPELLGGDWRRAEHARHGNHFQHQGEQDRGRRGRLHQKRPGGDTAAERRCRCSRSGSRRQHRWRPTQDGGNGSERASPASHFRRSCSDSACCNYSWREAFFRAHRARPQHILRELSLSASSSASTSAQQPQTPPPCIIVVLHGRVHDLTEFLPSHPGGSLILQEHAFTDATLAFERFFHSREARRIARQFVVWDGQAVMGRRGTLWKVAHQPSP